MVPHFWGGHWQASDTYYCDKKIVNRVLHDVGPLRTKTQERAGTANHLLGFISDFTGGGDALLRLWSVVKKERSTMTQAKTKGPYQSLWLSRKKQIFACAFFC